MSDSKKIQFVLQLSDIRILIKCNYQDSYDFCKKYIVKNNNYDFAIEIFPEDIQYEKDKSEQNDIQNSQKIIKYETSYYENLAIYRKIAEQILDYDIFLVHGSAIAVDGVAYMFMAKSGTGKSTHSNLWFENFKDRMQYINDDKPLLQICDNCIKVVGTPWSGKSNLDNNISVPLSSICFLEQAKENKIEFINSSDAFSELYKHVYLPKNKSRLLKTLDLLDLCLKKINYYKLGCNTDKSSAIIAYEKMKGEFGLKLKDCFVSHTTHGEQILVDAEGQTFSGIVRNNKTAAFIVECLKTETTKEEILKKIKEKFDGPEETMKRDIDNIIANLDKIGAINWNPHLKKK